MDKIPVTLIKVLQNVDTPTVCNAIEVAEGRRLTGYSSPEIYKLRIQSPFLKFFIIMSGIGLSSEKNGEGSVSVSQL